MPINVYLEDEDYAPSFEEVLIAEMDDWEMPCSLEEWLEFLDSLSLEELMNIYEEFAPPVEE